MKPEHRAKYSEVFEKLPENWRELLEERHSTSSSPHVETFPVDENNNDLSAATICGFIWASSPEGSSYWNYVHTTLIDNPDINLIDFPTEEVVARINKQYE